MGKTVCKFIILLIILLIGCKPANIYDLKGITTLKLGTPIDASIAGGDIDTFQVQLKKDQFIYVVVMQRGIDLVSRLIGPNKEQIKESDIPYIEDFGPEIISLTAETAGMYQIEVTPFNPVARRARYRISLAKLQAAATSAEEKVDELFSYWDNDYSPGAAVAVLKDGQIVYKQGYGMANRESKIPMTPQTKLHICSESKQFTAFAIGMLVQQGKLNLDDNIRKYLPEMPVFARKITIRHLIHHSSGLRDADLLAYMSSGRGSKDIKDKLEILSQQKELSFIPGEKFLYCNTGYTMLAEIVTRAVGESFTEWVTKNIFHSLGMQNTSYKYEGGMKAVRSYAVDDDGRYRRQILGDIDPGAGGIISTVEDLSKWIKNYEHPVVGDAQIMALLETRGVLNSGDTLDYAFGQSISNYRGMTCLEHGGGAAGYRSHILRFPAQRFAVIILSNWVFMNPHIMARKIADIYLAEFFTEQRPASESIQKRPVAVIDPFILRKYTGKFMDACDNVILISCEKNQLYARTPGDSKVAIYPINENTFFSKLGKFDISFSQNENGNVDLLIADKNNREISYFKVDPFAFNENRFQNYEGDYFSEELSVTYRIDCKWNYLFIRPEWNGDRKLIHIKNDSFKVNIDQNAWIHFYRNSDYEIAGFFVDTDRDKNIRFIRNN